MANSTDKSILTAAGKALLAQLNAEEKALVIDKMIFANVPNRPEYPQPDDVVPTDHIVHQEQVEQRGRLSADSVIYSTTLTSDVGPFDFNWTGAYCSEYGVLVTIDHHALTPKTADEPGVAGNTLVRSVVLEYKDIAEITNITVDASTWQYDARKRLEKMDSDAAQSLIDQNGKDWFIEDGFFVTPAGSAYSIKAGAGYVSGNRVLMEFDRTIQVANKPSFIYIDAHREGTSTGEQVTLFSFVVTAEEKDDYIDSSTGKDVKHFVCKIAQVHADGSVSDLRKEGSIEYTVNSKLCAQFNRVYRGRYREGVVVEENSMSERYAWIDEIGNVFGSITNSAFVMPSNPISSNNLQYFDVGTVKGTGADKYKDIGDVISDLKNANNYSGIGNEQIEKAINDNASLSKIRVTKKPMYDCNVKWKGVPHETIDLPHKINSYEIPNGGLGARMCVGNGILYECDYTNSAVNVFNLGDPRKPEKMASIPTGSQPRHVDIIGGRFMAVCCHGTSKIEFYDMSHPTSGLMIGSIITGDNPKMFVVDGNEIYVVCFGSSTLEKYEYVLPTSTSEFKCVKKGQVNVPSGPLSVASNGSGLLAVSGLNTDIVQLVGSTSLNLISAIGLGSNGIATCEWINKTTLIAAMSNNSELATIDYTKISSPSVMDTVQVVGRPEQVTIIGDSAYVPSLTGAGTQSKISAVDITDPSNLYEYKQESLSVCGAGFTAYYERGNYGYLYVNGHFAPFNIDVIEIRCGNSPFKENNTKENISARKASFGKLEVGELISPERKYRTNTTNSVMGEDDEIVRLGNELGVQFELLNPEAVKGKEITICNVHETGEVVIVNRYLGVSGVLPPQSSVTIKSMDYVGQWQWDGISSFKPML
ncbi:phage tail protein [Vibrio parahaemolyticus]|uniref:phage tail protein n=1 Tax=Vibrio parahaemolyticus TaxID=670 RepID=UPI002150C6C8|nr:phage tail protein [Vibrio parahaemolyticus]